MARSPQAALVIFDRADRYPDAERVVAEVLKKARVRASATGSAFRPGILKQRHLLPGIAAEFFVPILGEAYEADALEVTPFRRKDGTEGLVLAHPAAS